MPAAGLYATAQFYDSGLSLFFDATAAYPAACVSKAKLSGNNAFCVDPVKTRKFPAFNAIGSLECIAVSHFF